MNTDQNSEYAEAFAYVREQLPIWKERVEKEQERVRCCFCDKKIYDSIDMRNPYPFHQNNHYAICCPKCYKEIVIASEEKEVSIY